jgi:hypothetical protein
LMDHCWDIRLAHNWDKMTVQCSVVQMVEQKEAMTVRNLADPKEQWMVSSTAKWLAQMKEKKLAEMTAHHLGKQKAVCWGHKKVGHWVALMDIDLDGPLGHLLEYQMAGRWDLKMENMTVMKKADLTVERLVIKKEYWLAVHLATK